MLRGTAGGSVGGRVGLVGTGGMIVVRVAGGRVDLKVDGDEVKERREEMESKAECKWKNSGRG